MDLALISNDIELKNLIERSEFFTDVELYQRIDNTTVSNLEESCIAISDEMVSPKELSFVDIKQNQTAFYMMQNHHNSELVLSIKAVCASKGIILVPNGLTVNQVADFIIKTFSNSDDAGTKVVTFFSTISNIGTTTTCLSVARAISENTKSRVGVLLLNAWDKGTHQLEFKGKYLNELKGRLANKAISSKEEFYSSFHMYAQDKLYILGGNSDVKLERLYTKEEIEYLIQLSKKYFDIVLIDAGCHFDNINMLQALHQSNMRFLVVNQQYKAVKQFKQVFDEILYPLGYKKTNFMVLVNQVIDSSQLSTPRTISDELDVILLASVYNIQNAWVTELNSTMLYDISELYRDSINVVSRSIISQYGLELDEDVDSGKRKKKWFGIGGR